MGRNRRDRRKPNTRVVHVTNRVWEGLPFVPNRLVTRIIKGVLARAQCLYPVNICAHGFMGNHYHMILAGDANRVSSFMGYLNGEIARRFKKLMPNRWGPRFWVDRYKEQELVTPEDVIAKLGYIFCNPLEARLVSDLKSYPGVNSFQSLYSKDYKTNELCSLTYARHFRALESAYISKKEDIRLSIALQKKASEYLHLKTDLFGWLKCFKQEISKEEVVEGLKAKIAASEKKAASLGVIGAERLRVQPVDKEHFPVKKGKTVYIECCNKELRKKLIKSYQHFRNLCREAWERVKRGLAAVWPRGAIVPSSLWRSEGALLATG